MTDSKIDQLKEAASNAAVTAIVADRAAEASHAITQVQLGDRIFYSVPEGRDLKDIESYLPYPYRTKGEQPVSDSESFLTIVHHFDGAPALVSFSQRQLFALCTFNYPDKDKAGWQDHKVKWQLVKHRDLKAWEAIMGKDLSQLQLMEFLEDRLVDITDEYKGPSQSQFESVISNLEITSNSKFQAKRELSSGNYVMHCDSEGTPSVEVPKVFQLGLPIFEGLDLAYRLDVFLRYRVQEGAAVFKLAFKNFDAVLDEAWEKVTQQIKDGLGAVPFINVP